MAIIRVNVGNATRAREASVRQYTEERERNAPTPLPEPFKSTPLLARLDPSGEASQAESPLFQLPPEIRRIIYAYVFEAGGAVHILRMVRRLAYLRFSEKQERPADGILRPQFCSPIWQARTDIWRPQYHQSAMEQFGIWLDEHYQSVEVKDVARIAESRRELLALLKTCRRAYADALPVLYSSTEFDFTSVLNLSYFLDTVPRCNVDWITSLSVWCVVEQYDWYKDRTVKGFVVVEEETWERVWGAVASLPRLRKLAVLITTFNDMRKAGIYFLSREFEERMVAPLRKITAPNVFWLGFLYPDESANEPEIEESPFRLLRQHDLGPGMLARRGLRPAHDTWPLSDYPGVT